MAAVCSSDRFGMDTNSRRASATHGESNTNNARDNPLNNPRGIVAKPPPTRMHYLMPLLILAWIDSISLMSVGGNNWNEKSIVYQISEDQKCRSLVDLERLWIVVVDCQDGPSPPFHRAVLPLVHPACRIRSLFGKGNHPNAPVLSRFSPHAGLKFSPPPRKPQLLKYI
jgi:hypothetical protein